MTIIVLSRPGERSLIILNSSLNDPAEPPNNIISDVCQRAMIFLLIANFLVDVFFRIDYLKPVFEAWKPYRFLTA